MRQNNCDSFDPSSCIRCALSRRETEASAWGMPLKLCRNSTPDEIEDHIVTHMHNWNVYITRHAMCTALLDAPEHERCTAQSLTPTCHIHYATRCEGALDVTNPLTELRSGRRVGSIWCGHQHIPCQCNMCLKCSSSTSRPHRFATRKATVASGS